MDQIRSAISYHVGQALQCMRSIHSIGERELYRRVLRRNIGAAMRCRCICVSPIRPLPLP